MKKLKLTQQIILLITSILLLCGCLFTILVIIQSKQFATTEMYSRLESILTLTPDDNDFLAYSSNIKPCMLEGKVIYEEGNFYVSEYKIKPINQEYLADNDCERICKLMSNEYAKIKGTSFDRPINVVEKGQLDGSKGLLFYAYEIHKDGMFRMILTDQSFIISMLKSMTYKIFGVFLLIMLVASLVICLWSNGVVKRIKKIQTHIDNLPNENYEIKYDDGGADEISDLGHSVMDMRHQVLDNDKIKREMLQNVSHDLKTPIAVIKSYAESIIDGVSEPMDAQIILNQADILRNKVNKLLQYNRLEYLSKDKDFDDINMKNVVKEVVETYKHQSPLKFDLDLEDVIFKGYRENYYTIVDNIVDNAKRYAKTTIKIILKNDELVIYNDGEHIDEQFLKAEFKPYEKGSKGQFGLGMSIVVKTLDFFNMKLRVKNENIGVSFIITKK